MNLAFYNHSTNPLQSNRKGPFYFIQQPPKHDGPACDERISLLARLPVGALALCAAVVGRVARGAAEELAVGLAHAAAGTRSGVVAVDDLPGAVQGSVPVLRAYDAALLLDHGVGAVEEEHREDQRLAHAVVDGREVDHGGRREAHELVDLAHVVDRKLPGLAGGPGRHAVEARELHVVLAHQEQVDAEHVGQLDAAGRLPGQRRRGEAEEQRRAALAHECDERHAGEAMRDATAALGVDEAVGRRVRHAQLRPIAEHGVGDGLLPERHDHGLVERHGAVEGLLPLPCVRLHNRRVAEEVGDGLYGGQLRGAKHLRVRRLDLLEHAVGYGEVLIQRIAIKAHERAARRKVGRRIDQEREAGRFGEGKVVGLAERAEDVPALVDFGKHVVLAVGGEGDFDKGGRHFCGRRTVEKRLLL